MDNTGEGGVNLILGRGPKAEKVIL